MTTETETTLSELIADAVERVNGALDFDEVATRVIDSLTEKQLKDCVRHDVRTRVRLFVANRRSPATPRSGNASPRWSQEARDAINDWYLSFTDRPPKALLESSADDLLDSAEWYARRAEGYGARAESYRKLARVMRRAKVEAVSDLPREKVRRILDA